MAVWIYILIYRINNIFFLNKSDLQLLLFLNQKLWNFLFDYCIVKNILILVLVYIWKSFKISFLEWIDLFKLLNFLTNILIIKIFCLQSFIELASILIQLYIKKWIRVIFHNLLFTVINLVYILGLLKLKIRHQTWLNLLLSWMRIALLMRSTAGRWSTLAPLIENLILKVLLIEQHVSIHIIILNILVILIIH